MMFRKITCAGLVLALSGIVSAATIQWKSVSSGNWETASNWGSGTVPTISDQAQAYRSDGLAATITVTTTTAAAGKFQMKYGTPTLNINAGTVFTNSGTVELYQGTATTVNVYGTWSSNPGSVVKFGGGGSTVKVNVYGLATFHNAASNSQLQMGYQSGGSGTLTIYSGGVVNIDSYSWFGNCPALIDLKSGGRLYILGDARIQVNSDIGLGRIVGNGIAGNLITKYDGTKTNVQVPDPITVGVLAGTSAGWNFYDINTNIAGGDAIDINDLQVLAAHWLNSPCNGTNDGCGRADIDASGNVDFLDYALLANDWSQTVADNVLLQTIYGTAQGSAGNITANDFYALNQNQGIAIAFKVPYYTAIDTVIFKFFGISPSNDIRIRLYDVNGLGYLTSGHTMTRAAPGGSGKTIIDFHTPVSASISSHSELGDGRAYSDLSLTFGPQEVNAGEYLLVLDANGPANTWGNIVRGNNTESATMGLYPDGVPLPKHASVTTSGATGNTYFYQLTGSADASYTPVSNLPAFQITLNQAPKVNAGPDQTIYDPANSVTLNATATDDGLPNPPGAVTVHWTQQKGPGTVTFADPNALNTTATFSALGVYVLRLTASDSQLSSYDEVTITVMPASGNTIVYHVTNLNNSGTGSFASCLALANTDGLPSKIVFDVNGTIFPPGIFSILEPNTTIQGPMAPPGSGITFDMGGHSIAFDCQNTGFNHFCNLYIRNTGANLDGITIGTANNIVERCTFELCGDEGVNITGPYARNNIVAFSRFESCGSQPGDGTNYANGRGILITVDGSAVLVGNYINHCNRGVTVNGAISFVDFRHNFVEYSLSPGSGAGFSNAGSIGNAISNVCSYNTTVGYHYLDNCTFYRSGNTGTGNSGGLESVESGSTEVFSVITVPDTPFPSWLNSATTPASGNDVGQGTGACISCQ